MEAILQPSIGRWTPIPVKYNEAWDLYKQHVASFWTVEEIDFSDDRKSWDTLSKDEQHFLKHILAFFAASDGIVIENLAERFMSEIQVPEIRQFYSFQIAMEAIHAETYGRLLEIFVPDIEEQNHMFSAVSEVPSVKEKAEWALKWIQDKEACFAQRLVAFAIVEGLFFSGSFCAIYFFKQKGKCHGLTFSNELIARDEGLHTKFACHVYSLLQNKLDSKTVRQMMKEALEIEERFIQEALPKGRKILGMNKDLMMQYIKSVADVLMVMLGYDKFTNVSNPFTWMDMISLQGKTNFFSRRVAEYQKAGVMDKIQQPITDDLFTNEADF